MKKIILLFVIVALTSNAVSAQPEFQPFVWAEYEIDGKVIEKAEILLPVKLPMSDKKYYMSFETCGNTTTFYGHSLIARGFLKQIDFSKVFRFNFFESISDEYPFVYSAEYNTASAKYDTASLVPKKNVIGTICHDFLSNKIMVIDYFNEKFMFLSDSTDMPTNIKEKIQYLTITHNAGLNQVDLPIGGDTIRGVSFNSGYPPITLSLTLDDWVLATGKKPDDSGVIKKIGDYSIKPRYNYYAPMKTDLIIGDVVIPAPLVAYDEWGQGYRFKFFGNGLFSDAYTIVIDRINSRFGILKSKKDEN